MGEFKESRDVQVTVDMLIHLALEPTEKFDGQALKNELDLLFKTQLEGRMLEKGSILEATVESIEEGDHAPMKCPFLGCELNSEDCTEHCQLTTDGIHTPDPNTVKMEDGVLVITCSSCEHTAALGEPTWG
jgi:hypothetical protein